MSTPEKVFEPRALIGVEFISDAADRLGFTRAYVHKLVERGLFPNTISIGSGKRKVVLVTTEDVDAYAASRAASAVASLEDAPVAS
jgi:predicted DNA-binding transcriptional regulator AlpA